MKQGSISVADPLADFLLEGNLVWGGGVRPHPMRAPFGEVVCENERIWPHGSAAEYVKVWYV